jgi:hypothetical protein
VYSKARNREEIGRDMDVQQVAVCFLSEEIPGERIALMAPSGDL